MSVEEQARPRRRWLVLLPLAVFVGLASLFMAQLLSGRDEQTLPSVLIGLPAPETKLPPLAGLDLPGIDSQKFAGRVTLLNVWASWCAPCREEQPTLMQLSADRRFDMVGLNYKDKPDNARRFLDQLGNPFAAVGEDSSGRAGIDWGVYGVPESYVIGRDGRVLFKHVGPLDAQSVGAELMPQIEKALKAGG